MLEMLATLITAMHSTYRALLGLSRTAQESAEENSMNCNNLKPLQGCFFRLVPALVILAGTGFGCLTACTNGSQRRSDEQLRQDTARTTEKAKQQSKEALADARVAAGRAEQKVNDIADGVKDGLQSKTPSSAPRIDLNTASQKELSSLPGISEPKARQIIRHRPYASAHQLVDRGLLSESQFAGISSDVTAH